MKHRMLSLSVHTCRKSLPFVDSCLKGRLSCQLSLGQRPVWAGAEEAGKHLIHAVDWQPTCLMS